MLIYKDLNRYPIKYNQIDTDDNVLFGGGFF